MLKVESQTETKTLTIFISGHMDTLKSATLAEQIPAQLPESRVLPEWTLIMDLAAVDYISSSFIRLCVSTAKMAAPGRFSIVRCQPFVQKTFVVAGLQEALNVS